MDTKRTTWVALLSVAVLAGCAAQAGPTDDDDDSDDPVQVAVWCGGICATEGQCVDTAQCECFFFAESGLEECYAYGQAGAWAGNNEDYMQWVCCQAYSDADCAGSSACIEQGRCTACDGFCHTSCPP